VDKTVHDLPWQTPSEGYGRKRHFTISFSPGFRFESGLEYSEPGALCAALYKQVLGLELGEFGQMERAKKPERLPTVMRTQEAARVLAAMTETNQMMSDG
jgi:hypothetical protein